MADYLEKREWPRCSMFLRLARHAQHINIARYRRATAEPGR